ncbi:MAG TPA: YicC/YloC family endoribonuclease [Candidatus Saccharimonadales bacterium]|nr:YicC/YloC family endoribonuclease [Candidatus Saccharimonadales bacterium]
MTQSMTGFASAIVEIPINATEKLSLSLHLKSLNSRYFEATCKLPYILTNLEVLMQRILKKKLERGHVYLTIKIQHDATKHVVIPSVPMIKEYLQAIKIIQKTCDLKEEVSLQTVLQLPNILHVEEESLNSKTEEKILNAVQDLADSLIETRKTEGKVLADDIEFHVKEIAKKLATIKKSSSKTMVNKKQDLEKLITCLQNSVNQEVSVESCLLENQKVTLLGELEKIDINEEIVRATSHIKNIIQLLKEDSVSKGKKLDFTLQELNRETNTIASKCSQFSISSLTIDIKTDLEKAREQAQNIL